MWKQELRNKNSEIMKLKMMKNQTEKQNGLKLKLNEGFILVFKKDDKK